MRAARLNGAPACCPAPGPRSLGLPRCGSRGDLNGGQSNGSDWRGLVDEIEIGDSAGIAVEQIDDEITVSIASVISVHFQVTPDQAVKPSKPLAVAAGNAAKFLASAET